MLQLLATRIKGKRILLLTDNRAVMHMLQNMYSRSEDLRGIISSILKILEAHEIDLAALWISTTENVLADRLSRLC